ncbi:MAG: hypothetical protein QXZ44_01680 [Ferroplasma sp.]
MKVLLSIKPEYVEKILNNEKKYEFRRKIFKKTIKYAYIYSTRPVKKVTGSFKIEGIIEDAPEILWEKYGEYSGITKIEFFKYFSNCKTGYAIKISNAKKLKGRKLPRRPPQSYYYIESAKLLYKNE